MFASPKVGKLRDVPLPVPVADALRAHMKRLPPVDVPSSQERTRNAVASVYF